MGRIKDLVIELQNEFGFDMEFLPEDFNMDEYLAKKAQEVEVNYTEDLFCNQVKSKNK
jgi:hypothetical protein